VAAVSAAKVAKYLQSVLHELGFGQGKLTPLCVNNQAAIAMVNEQKPTRSLLSTHPYPTLCNTRVESCWWHWITSHPWYHKCKWSSYKSPWMDSPLPSRPSIHGSPSSPLASFQSSSHLYITLSCATICSRINGIPSLEFREGVVAQEYDESWLVTSVISVDMCDCLYPWLAPWWTHSCPCALNNIFYQLFEAELLRWYWQLPNRGGPPFSLFINR
jgi:hypothetical protein